MSARVSRPRNVQTVEQAPRGEVYAPETAGRSVPYAHFCDLIARWPGHRGRWELKL